MALCHLISWVNYIELVQFIQIVWSYSSNLLVMGRWSLSRFGNQTAKRNRFKPKEHPKQEPQKRFPSFRNSRNQSFAVFSNVLEMHKTPHVLALQVIHLGDSPRGAQVKHADYSKVFAAWTRRNSAEDRGTPGSLRFFFCSWETEVIQSSLWVLILYCWDI